MLLILLCFSAAIALLIHFKIKRTGNKFLIGGIAGFFGSITLGLVIGLIVESTGNPQLGKDIALIGFKSCLGTAFYTVIFLLLFQYALKGKQESSDK